MKKHKERKPFKREYIPVIIAAIVLIGLITGLVFVILDKKEDFDIKIDEEIKSSEDLKVDTSGTKCNNEESKKVKDAAQGVEVSYTIKKMFVGTSIDIDQPDMPEVEEYDYGFEIAIKNITEDVYVVVKNDYSDDVFTYHYADTENGVKTFESIATEEAINFTFEVKSENANCKDEDYRKISLTTPIYNYYHRYQFCSDNPKSKVCKMFVNEKISAKEFATEVNAKKEENQKSDDSNKKNVPTFVKENKYLFIIGGIVIVIIGVATVCVKIKKRRGSKL